MLTLPVNLTMEEIFFLDKFVDQTKIQTPVLVACWCYQVMAQTVNHIMGNSSLSCSYAQWYCKWVSAAVRCSYCA